MLLSASGSTIALDPAKSLLRNKSMAFRASSNAKSKGMESVVVVVSPSGTSAGEASFACDFLSVNFLSLSLRSLLTFVSLSRLAASSRLSTASSNSFGKDTKIALFVNLAISTDLF